MGCCLIHDLGLTNFFCTSFVNDKTGCGVHIHEGTSCESADTQGGRLFVAPVTTDPWAEERYETDATGYTTFKGIVTQGTTDIAGRAFIGKFGT